MNLIMQASDASEDGLTPVADLRIVINGKPIRIRVDFDDFESDVTEGNFTSTDTDDAVREANRQDALSRDGNDADYIYKLHAAYDQGYEQGYEDGFADGKESAR